MLKEALKNEVEDRLVNDFETELTPEQMDTLATKVAEHLIGNDYLNEVRNEAIDELVELVSDEMGIEID